MPVRYVWQLVFLYFGTGRSVKGLGLVLDAQGLFIADCQCQRCFCCKYADYFIC